MEKIIIFESDTDSLRTFANLMAEGFKELGWQVLRADMVKESQAREDIYKFTEQGRTAALFFNHAGLNLLTKDRASIWNELDVDCYDFIVDHPVYYHAAIIFPIRRLAFLCVDEYHQKFIQRFYSGKVRSFFLPLAGIRSQGPQIPFEERSMDLLFTGAYLVDNNVEYHIRGLGEGLRQVWLDCYQLLCRQTSLTLEQGMEFCLKKKGIVLPEEDLRDTIRLFQDMDGMLRSRARAEVVRTLADQDVKIHIYGEGWQYLDCKQENLIIHDRIPFDETIPLMADARIVLNVMPWFKSGVHDRIYSAMLNGSVSLTDGSEYTDRTLTDGREVLLYSLEYLQDLPGKIKKYLQKPQELKEIAGRGYEYARDAQTWKHRAYQLADLIEHGSLQTDRADMVKTEEPMKIKIFTMTHRKFSEPQDSIYIPLHVGRAGAKDLGYLGDDTGDSISRWNHYYGELTGVYWVWKNEHDADVVGICHYRRFFLNEQRQLLSRQEYEEILKDYDIIVSDNIQADASYLDYFAEAHNARDLLAVGEVIKEKYPEYEPYFKNAMEGNTYYYGNLMVAPRKLFQEYAAWLFDILFEVEKRINVESYDLYNQRVFGFLSEQMVKIWVEKNGLKVYEGNVGLTSEKAETMELKLAMTQLVKLKQITQAREMFYEYLKVRPDVRLELSDIRGEVPIIELLLYIAQEEEQRNISGLSHNSWDLTEWISHFRNVMECLGRFARGEEKQEDIDYILQRQVSWVMIKVMLMNADPEVIADPSLALQAVYEIYKKAERTSDCEGLEQG